MSSVPLGFEATVEECLDQSRVSVRVGELRPAVDAGIQYVRRLVWEHKGIFPKDGSWAAPETFAMSDRVGGRDDADVLQVGIVALRAFLVRLEVQGVEQSERLLALAATDGWRPETSEALDVRGVTTEEVGDYECC